ncbi:MAG: hypothetical protein C0443_09110 [Comamonadaceae bacterium]|nr:hypothetical protein [Comamonadaceae bacterium]
MALYVSLYAIAAMLLAFGSVLAVVVAAREVDRFGPNAVVGLYLWLILLGPTVRLVVAPREYLTNDITTAEYTAVAGWVSWVLRLSSMALVGTAAAVIFLWLIHRQRQAGAAFLAVGLGVLFLAMVSSATLGEKPAFVHNSYYAVLLMGSLLVLPRLAPEQVAVHAKRVLTVIMIGSLVLGALYTSRFAQTNYAGMIPGFNFRLHGLAPHANSIAPLALLYLLLATWVPGRQPWHAIGLVAAGLVFLLAQSKTVWGAAVLIVCTLAIYRLHQQFIDEMRHARLGWATLVTFGVGFAFVLAVFWLLSDAASGLFETVQQDKGVTTLTGRTDIWRTTIETWERNPVFGYGPTLWSLEFRLQHGAALAAWHAHNQYLQALGESGLLGLGAVLLYTGALVYYGFKFAARTKGISLALLLLLLVRTISEIPLRLNVLLDTTFFVHLVVFAIFLMLSREEGAQASERAARLQVAPA